MVFAGLLVLQDFDGLFLRVFFGVFLRVFFGLFFALLGAGSLILGTDRFGVLVSIAAGVVLSKQAI